MIVSLLHLVLTIRALVRSIAQRFVLGILGGLVRAALLVGALALAAQRASIFMAPTTRTAGTSALGTLVVAFGGPLVTFVVVWAAWKRFQDVPAAREEELQRPFGAWLPVGLIDALSVVVTIAAAMISEW